MDVLQDLRESHHQLVQTHLKVKSGLVSKDAFLAKALNSGFIDRVEDIFQNAISNSSESVLDWGWKPHWGMIETLLRELKTPALHSIGMTAKRLPLDFKELDVSEASIDFIYNGSGRANEIVPYVSEIIKKGVVSFPSPTDGTELTSIKGFIFYQGGKPYIFLCIL